MLSEGVQSVNTILIEFTRNQNIPFRSGMLFDLCSNSPHSRIQCFIHENSRIQRLCFVWLRRGACRTNSWRSRACNYVYIQFIAFIVRRIGLYQPSIQAHRRSHHRRIHTNTLNQITSSLATLTVSLSLSLFPSAIGITSRSLWLRCARMHIRAKKVSDWIRWILSGERWTRSVKKSSDRVS